MTRYTLRSRSETIVIDAELIGSASSREAGKPRWGDYRLFRLPDGGGYVLAGVGRSTIDGETDRPWFKICETADAIVRALLYERRPGVWVLPPSGRALLDAAAANDLPIREHVKILDKP